MNLDILKTFKEIYGEIKIADTKFTGIDVVEEETKAEANKLIKRKE